MIPEKVKQIAKEIDDLTEQLEDRQAIKQARVVMQLHDLRRAGSAINRDYEIQRIELTDPPDPRAAGWQSMFTTLAAAHDVKVRFSVTAITSGYARGLRREMVCTPLISE